MAVQEGPFQRITAIPGGVLFVGKQADSGLDDRARVARVKRSDFTVEVETDLIGGSGDIVSLTGIAHVNGTITVAADNASTGVEELIDYDTDLNEQTRTDLDPFDLGRGHIVSGYDDMVYVGGATDTNTSNFDDHVIQYDPYGQVIVDSFAADFQSGNNSDHPGLPILDLTHTPDGLFLLVLEENDDETTSLGGGNSIFYVEVISVDPTTMTQNWRFVLDGGSTWTNDDLGVKRVFTDSVSGVEGNLAHDTSGFLYFSVEQLEQSFDDGGNFETGSPGRYAAKLRVSDQTIVAEYEPDSQTTDSFDDGTEIEIVYVDERDELFVKTDQGEQRLATDLTLTENLTNSEGFGFFNINDGFLYSSDERFALPELTQDASASFQGVPTFPRVNNVVAVAPLNIDELLPFPT